MFVALRIAGLRVGDDVCGLENRVNCVDEQVVSLTYSLLSVFAHDVHRHVIQIGVELKITSSCDTDWRGTENSITHNGKSKLSNSITCLSLK